MTHIDQHILELYVLGSKDVLRRRASIDRHLVECAGCRSLVDEMREYYGDVDRKYSDRAKDVSISEHVLTKRNVAIPSLFTPVAAPVLRREGAVGEVRWFIRQHPFLSASSGVFLLGALALLASFVVKSPFEDRTLVSFKYNVGENTLEALNGDNDVLWKKPSVDVTRTVSSEGQYRIHKTLVAELDEDGKNELLTIVPLWDTRRSDWAEGLRVFNSDSDLIWESQFNRSTHYGDRLYAADYNPVDMLVDKRKAEKGQDVLVALCNNRSPYFLARFDHRGMLVGEYWHFGQLARISSFTAQPGEKPLILLAGINDMDDATNRSFPVVVAIDPNELNGQTESSVTRGFGYPKSKAEVFYVRLPRTDIADALETSEAVTVRMKGDGSTARFCVSTSERVGLEYVFSSSMEVMEVKPFSGFEALHASLASEGKIRSVYGPAYLENLKKGVRYWDGKEWRKEVTRLQHGP